MAETWPITLPQYVNESGFSVSFSSSSLSTKMSTGYDKRRRKFTGQYLTYTVSINMTLDELDTFEDFFNTYLGYGVVDFNFPDPLFIDDYILVRIKANKGEYPYTITPYGDNEDAVVSFTLEQLVTGYTAISHSIWPSTIPQCPLYDNYVCEIQSGIIRDADYDSGYMSVRRRFNAVIRRHHITFVMSRDELEIFLNFYFSIGYGSLDFTAPYPFDETQTIRARFDSENGFSVEYANAVDLFTVSFIWEELPLLKEYT